MKRQFNLKFEDFTPEQLIGMDVLLTTNNGSTINKIISATKTKIKFANADDRSLITGNPVGFNPNDRSNWGTHHKMELLSEIDAINIKNVWAINKQRKVMTEEIMKQLTNHTLTLEELTKIKNIINHD